MKGRSRRVVLVSVIGLSAFACGRSAEPTYYALSPTRGATFNAPALLVKVLRVSVAGYLDRETIVRAIRDNRLELAAGEHWSEPLASMLTRVLVEDLAERLPRAGIFAEGAGIDTEASVLLNVDCEHFERSGENAIIQAQITLRVVGHPPSPPERIRLEQKPNGVSTSSDIDAYNALLGRLADSIVQMLFREVSLHDS